MDYDKSKNGGWVISKNNYLPGLRQLFDETRAPILIIGASVFELYQMQGWIPSFKRQTGDIDLSVGIVQNDSNYRAAKEKLESLNYKVDSDHPYRFRPPKTIPGRLSYIDLLAYPTSSATKTEIAVKAMGVGLEFTFDGFEFAKKYSFELQKNIFFPNVFGMLALKIESYEDDPNRRIKDFADIIELISGLVENGQHFVIEKIWKQMSHEPEAIKVKNVLESITKETPAWDYEDTRNDLLKRNFDAEFIDRTLLERIKDFLMALT